MTAAERRSLLRRSFDEEAAGERSLLEGVRRREPEALGRFFDLVFPYIYGLAFRLCGDHTNAEDIAQDVFLKIHRAADRLDPSRPPRPWLSSITVNTFRDSLRRSSVRRIDEDKTARIVAEQPSVPTPENGALRKEREEMLQRALLALDEESRTLVLMRDYGDASHQEIAEALGISHAATRKRYSRALRQLKELLEKEADERP